SNLLSMVQNSGYLNDNSNDVMANLDLNYKLDRFLPGLYFRGRGNVSVQSSSVLNRSKQAPVYTLVVSPGGDSAYNLFGTPINQINSFTSTSWARYTFAQLSLGYDKKFGDHNIQSMVLFDQKTTLLNYDIPGKLTNIAGKVSYDFKGKYMAEGALNYSGYNRYQPGDQFGLFYAAGLGWNVAQESFIKDNVSWINEMKLRATFGQTGNANVDNYGYYIYRSYFQDVAGTYPIGSGYPNGGGLAEGGTGFGNQTLANIKATWEKAHKFDAGIDLSLFNNRIQFTADYYYERYYDILQQRGKTIELIGQQYPFENIGINRFSGWEFTGTYQSHYRDFNFFVTGNASIQQSRVLFVDEQFQPNEWNKRTGQMVGQRFGLVTDGIVQSYDEIATTPTLVGYALRVGDYKYKDLNNDGVIDQFDAAPIGKKKPLIYFGLNAGFSYKGFAVSALIQGVTNREVYAGSDVIDQGFLNQNNGFSQGYEQVLGRWIPENGLSATSPRLTPGGSGYNYSPIFLSNSALLHDGNYFRLKNISVEYNLPYQLIRNLKVAGVKLFFNAQNLATWSAYDLQDPEVVLPNYPIQKVVNFGINIKI
ncbi:MAG: SusC/RagA family TonB-linked outer membrane protein, partial [Chitinophagaceae bacterium]